MQVGIVLTKCIKNKTININKFNVKYYSISNLNFQKTYENSMTFNIYF